MSTLEKREHTTLRIPKSMKETIRKLFPEADSFNEAFIKYVEASENMRKRLESTTQIEIPYDKTESPQIENQIPPCDYASLTVKKTKQGFEYLAFCDNPQKTHIPKNRLISISACQKCYERMKDPMTEINKKMRFYFCYMLRDEDNSKLSNLPCIKNPEFECTYDKSLYEDEDASCPLLENKEWRRLFSKGTCNS